MRVLAADYRVEVGDISSASSVAAIAGAVLAAAPRSFALAGLSMGGIVALEMWRQAPGRIERLALLDTNFRAEPPERQRGREIQIRRARMGQLETLLREELKPNYLAACHRDNKALLDEVLAMGMELGSEVFVAQSRALRDRPDSTATLADIDCPTLVLCGDEDLLCPPDLHRQLARGIPEARLRIIENCGHLSTLEQPTVVTNAMQGWLRASSGENHAKQ